MRRLLLTAALVVLSAGCSKSEEAKSGPTQDGTLEPVANPHQPGDFEPLPDPEAQGGSVGRAPRRLTVAQLDAAIQEAVGRRWGGSDGIDARATSLGRADFALVASENTEPNLVFAKFLEDGARVVCIGQAADEVKLTDASKRTLSRTLPGTWDDLRKLSSAQVNEFLVYNSLRFWGAPLEGEELTKWARFFTQAAARAETAKRRSDVLAVMCIAMLTDSRFITY
ncbi:putative lipoprotein [Myxococcus stipitatus DSM 14675]|uniref:Putative lipoprotein n=1 Tax=Myxococcus stipitatus (strain DSM 14675 / JCM 12634 / Mx s8) TaxID=1278073 RepID=L7U3I0_MYXSD|nr:lipoprotein [Myxococcus stipitatus]AGC42400.1 putative lipoprotein [Myxococcus stipitatus DSM 14675]